MALIHDAELKPAKLELLAAWLPTRDWFGEDGPVEREAAFRLDDPAGEVGIETFVVRSGAFRFHVPLTYRGRPLAEGTLVGELEHSVLGHRWIYDGPSDPVYRAVATDVIASGGHEVDAFFADGTKAPRAAWAASVTGTGLAAGRAPGELVVARALPAPVPSGAAALIATWAGLDAEVALAWLGPVA